MPLAEAKIVFEREISESARTRDHAQSMLSAEPETAFLLYEAALLRVFRATERTVGEVFIAYLLREQSLYPNSITTNFTPSDRKNALRVLQGGSRFVDWSDFGSVRDRSELFFGIDNPIQLAIQSNFQALTWMKSLRNHISHASDESFIKYQKALEHILTVAPRVAPSPGEFLASRPTKGAIKGREVFAYLLDQTIYTVNSCLESNDSNKIALPNLIALST